MTSPKYRIILILLVSLACARILDARDRSVPKLSPVQLLQLLHQKKDHRPGMNTTYHGGKCGLWLSYEVVRNWNNFNEAQKQEAKNLLGAPLTQKSRTIGHFSFLYDTIGFDVPAMLDSAYQPIPNSYEEYVDSAGRTFNHVWTFEIDTLGFPPPPLEGDGTYHVVITAVGSGEYGETDLNPYTINQTQPYRYGTHIQIDNSFANVIQSSRGMPALRVTAAHEFNHAIQIGCYGYLPDERYFYEITSTWMEDVVYNNVNDYYQYLFAGSSQFSQPDIRFTALNGSIEYSRAVWGKYVEKRFSRDLMRHVWEYIPQMSTLPALDHALTDAGSSFREAFLEWTRWNYYTGLNADTVNYYAEGRNYPDMILRSVDQYTSPGRSLEDGIQVISSAYHPILVNSTTMVAIISNINISSIGTDDTLTFAYDMSDRGGSGYKQLSNGISIKVDVPDPQNWSSWESVPAQTSEVIVFPDPFIAQSRKPLHFKLPSANQSTAVLHVFTSSLRLIYNDEVPVINIRPFEPGIVWDAHDNSGNLIASGIYFYFIEIDQKEYSGKFAVLRE